MLSRGLYGSQGFADSVVELKAVPVVGADLLSAGETGAQAGEGTQSQAELWGAP